jgi:hypothetical protein
MLKMILGRKAKTSDKQRLEQQELEMAKLTLQRRVQLLVQTAQQAA